VIGLLGLGRFWVGSEVSHRRPARNRTPRAPAPTCPHRTLSHSRGAHVSSAVQSERTVTERREGTGGTPGAVLSQGRRSGKESAGGAREKGKESQALRPLCGQPRHRMTHRLWGAALRLHSSGQPLSVHVTGRNQVGQAPCSRLSRLPFPCRSASARSSASELMPPTSGALKVRRKTSIATLKMAFAVIRSDLSVRLR
jgi:hypothetical protein